MQMFGSAVSRFLSRRVLRSFLAAACLGVVAAPAAAAEWLTGEALRAKLAQPENVVRKDAPLRQSVEGFCRAHRVAVLIDRRVDPGQTINCELRAVPVAAILRQIAESRGLGLTFFGPVAYLGPPQYTARLRTLAELRREDVRRLPADAAAKLARWRSFAWADFATPRELLQKLADEGEVEIWGLDQVPHDLWAAADLPPLPLVDRITLVAGQFDLTFTIAAAGRRLALVPLPNEVAIVRAYPAGREPQTLIDRWQTLAPQCQIKLAGGKIHVKGRLEDLEQIEGKTEAGAGSPAATAGPPSSGEARFTGRVANKPLGDVLEYVKAQFGLELAFDRQALARSGVSLDQLVSFSVKDANAEDLLEAILEPVGCTFHRRGNTIEIKPAQ